MRILAQSKNTDTNLVVRFGNPHSLVAIALLAGLLTMPDLLAQGAHEHGVAELNLVREGQVVQIEFFSPGANLLGFERMPASAKEWTLLASVVEDLEIGAWLLGGQLDNCDMRIEAMGIPSFSAGADEHNGHDHGDDHDDNDEAEHTVHVDFRVQYAFDCAGSVPSHLDIKAFVHFPAIERLNTQWIIAGRPGYSELTANASSLSLE